VVAAPHSSRCNTWRVARHGSSGACHTRDDFMPTCMFATWCACASSTHARTHVQELTLRRYGRCLMRRTCSKSPTRGRSCHLYILCTAAAPHPSLRSGAGLQLAQIAADGSAAEKALLADVTAKHPDAAYTELLRLFKVRCRMGTRGARCIWCTLHRVCCKLPRASARSRRTGPM
jgi:hypothetical protein